MPAPTPRHLRRPLSKMHVKDLAARYEAAAAATATAAADPVAPRAVSALEDVTPATAARVRQLRERLEAAVKLQKQRVPEEHQGPDGDEHHPDDPATLSDSPRGVDAAQFPPAPVLTSVPASVAAARPPEGKAIGEAQHATASHVSSGGETTSAERSFPPMHANMASVSAVKPDNKKAMQVSTQRSSVEMAVARLEEQESQPPIQSPDGQMSSRHRPQTSPQSLSPLSRSAPPSAVQSSYLGSSTYLDGTGSTSDLDPIEPIVELSDDDLDNIEGVERVDDFDSQDVDSSSTSNPGSSGENATFRRAQTVEELDDDDMVVPPARSTNVSEFLGSGSSPSELDGYRNAPIIDVGTSLSPPSGPTSSSQDSSYLSSQRSANVSRLTSSGRTGPSIEAITNLDESETSFQSAREELPTSMPTRAFPSNRTGGSVTSLSSSARRRRPYSAAVASPAGGAPDRVRPYSVSAATPEGVQARAAVTDTLQPYSALAATPSGGKSGSGGNSAYTAADAVRPGAGFERAQGSLKRLPKAKVVIARRRAAGHSHSASVDVGVGSDAMAGEADEGSARAAMSMDEPGVRRLVREYSNPRELLAGQVSLVDVDVLSDDGADGGNGGGRSVADGRGMAVVVARRNERQDMFKKRYDEYLDAENLPGRRVRLLSDEDEALDADGAELNAGGGSSKQRYRNKKRLFGGKAAVARAEKEKQRAERRERHAEAVNRRSSLLSGALDRVSMAADPWIDFITDANSLPVAKNRRPWNVMKRLFKRKPNDMLKN